MLLDHSMTYSAIEIQNIEVVSAIDFSEAFDTVDHNIPLDV